MRVPIVLEKGLLFADTCVFKKALRQSMVVIRSNTAMQRSIVKPY
jgi:hypothetical protein